uniref:Uncharacterized protein n=1 Tax=Ananas comosus var. bracteatus TaxID=296719 RepID=A0A6V7NYS0_ANACO|nr:unnamed protein product [Ananas comosus var. bracteatus]
MASSPSLSLSLSLVIVVQHICRSHYWVLLIHHATQIITVPCIIIITHQEVAVVITIVVALVHVERRLLVMSHVDAVQQYLIQGAEPAAQLQELGPEHGVLGLDGGAAPGGEVEGRHSARVLRLQRRRLLRQPLEVLLLPHPRPPRRLAVRLHPPPLLLLQHLLPLTPLRRRRRRRRSRRPAGTRHRHLNFFLI